LVCSSRLYYPCYTEIETSNYGSRLENHVLRVRHDSYSDGRDGSFLLRPVSPARVTKEEPKPRAYSRIRYKLSLQYLIHLRWALRTHSCRDVVDRRDEHFVGVL
jgi:hypothetical protein